MRTLLLPTPLRVLAFGGFLLGMASASQAFTLINYDPLLKKMSVGDAPPASGPSEISKGPRYAVSDNGCYIVFISAATNLMTGQSDGNGANDVFLYDCQSDKVTLVSHAKDAPLKAAAGESDQPVISPDGFFVVFRSRATDIVAPDSSFVGQSNIFLWDRLANTSALVSNGPGGPGAVSGDGDSLNGVISRGGGGRVVAFESLARNLVAGESLGFRDVFRWVGGTINRVSFGLSGEANGDSFNPGIDRSGNCVVYESEATNLVSDKASDDQNGSKRDVFFWKQGSTLLLSHTAPNGAIPGDPVKTGSDESTEPSISDDCRWFAFKSAAKDISLDQNGNSGMEVFYESDLLPTPEDAVLVSHRAGSNKDPGSRPSDSPILSRDGNWLAYASLADDLMSSQNDTAGKSDVFLYNIPRDLNTLVSHTAKDPLTAADAQSLAPEISMVDPLVSTEGVYVAFASEAKDIDPNQNDGNNESDVFLYNQRWNNSVVVSRRFASIAITGKGHSDRLAVSGNGYTVAFTSNSGDLIADDPETAGLDDVFFLRSFGLNMFLSARSTESQIVLEWITPATNYASMQVKVTSNPACDAMQFSDVTWSASLGAPVLPANSSLPVPFADPTGPIFPGTVHCYGIFVQRDSQLAIDPSDTPAATAVARTLEAAPGAVKWTSNVSGFVTLAQVGLGAQNVIAVANDGGVYGLARGLSGGFWSNGYWPFRTDPLPIQGRPGVLTLSVMGSTHTTFVGSWDGRVFAFDADLGARAGGARWYTTPKLGPVVQSGIAGMFTLFGGVGDHLLVGTRSSPGKSVFFALNPFDGSPRTGSPFDGGPLFSIGDVNTTASVDYARKQVYFASRKFTPGTDPSLWCVTLDAAGLGSSCWAAPDNTLPDDISGGAIERNGVVYVGDISGKVWAFDAAAGTNIWSYSDGTCAGEVKSFVLADRQGTAQDLYYATTGGGLCAVTDDPGGPLFKWRINTGIIPGPSAPVLTRIGGVAYVYVGSTDGNLYQIEADKPSAIKRVLVRFGATIGAPAFDGRDNMIYVGTDAGAIYAVQVPLP